MANTYLRFPQGKPKAITLSYDDGVEQDERLLQLMIQYGFKGTFNLSYGRTPAEGVTYPEGQVHRRMPLSWIKRVYNTPNAEIAIHGNTHPHMELMKGGELLEEITEDRKGWEKELGGIVRGMAYPYGGYNDRVVEALRMAGVAYARTTVSTEKFSLPKDWLRMPATCHHHNPRLMELAETFAAHRVATHPQLFYLWGHSYEFEQRNDWDVIEAFFVRMQNLPDVWYATNIEIYDYIQAYERLEYSCNGRRVYNPSVLPVWLERNGTLYCVNPAETVDLQ